jgi:hypothetical protein
MMAISNATGAIVLTTGNKSEMAVGYSTLYGDSAGGFAVIKDVPKTLVYELCRYRNDRSLGATATPNRFPIAVLEKAPSAELRADQRDDQSLPPYDVLDPLSSSTSKRTPRPRRSSRSATTAPGDTYYETGRSQRVQATPDAPRGAHLEEGLRTRPTHADHQRLSSRGLVRSREALAHLAACFDTMYVVMGEAAPTLTNDAYVVRTFESARAMGEVALALREYLDAMEPEPLTA